MGRTSFSLQFPILIPLCWGNRAFLCVFFFSFNALLLQRNVISPILPNRLAYLSHTIHLLFSGTLRSSLSCHRESWYSFFNIIFPLLSAHNLGGKYIIPPQKIGGQTYPNFRGLVILSLFPLFLYLISCHRESWSLFSNAIFVPLLSHNLGGMSPTSPPKI